tara:strand:+ start:1344 stop:2327 length:984 start_codon:yes stop_codon:yes gene_type:complete
MVNTKIKKIMFNLKPPEGSYGGGSFFVKNLSTFLVSKGWKVTYELEDNLDIIVIIDPRAGNYKKHGLNDIREYKLKHPNVKLIYRVNECDIKREISINIEPLIVETMLSVNYVIFVSKWLQDYYIQKYNLINNNFNNLKYTSILNGCNQNHFYNTKLKKINPNKIRIVTHHWSNNYLKGFHIYNKLDQILPDCPTIEFTYIGNYNPNYQPKNIKIKKPMCGIELGKELKQHDIYLTATQNEPGAMHYLEAMSSGLPVIYCNGGGGVHEICQKAGEEFTDMTNFFIKLNKIIDNYDNYVKNIDKTYLSSDRCSSEYYQIISKLQEFKN